MSIDLPLAIEIVLFFLCPVAIVLIWNAKLKKEIQKRKVAEERLSELLEKYEKNNYYLNKAIKQGDRQQQRLLDLNEELEKSKKKADKLAKTKSEFLANMSHEIRTPLNAILGFSELLHEQVADEHLRSYTKTIQTAGNTLLTLINDILDISKIDAGKLDIVYAPMNLAVLIQDTTEIFRANIEQKGLDFIVNIDSNIPTYLLLDEVRLRQILFNLLGNAVKFTDNGHIKLQVIASNLDHTKETLDLYISIEDTGIGIPKHQRRKVFELFEQQFNQNSKKYGGTGLGLSISKRLAKMMNGELILKSKVGIGSIFTLRLDTTKIAPKHSYESMLSSSKDKANTINFAHASILVVDDVKFNREFIAQCLKNQDLEITQAQNGAEAVELAKKEDFDLILMDIRMPVLNGFEATKIIKGQKNVPIIALTASVVLDPENAKAFEIFDKLLKKPISKVSLLHEMSHFLEYKKEIQVTTEIDFEPSEKSKENSQTIAQIINTQIIPLHQQSIQSNNIDTIKLFAQTLQELSKEYDIAIFLGFTEALLDAIAVFDIIKIQQLLKEFETKKEYLLSSI
jgi:signal transduction histidine kinase/CheY-like chemotaxis protein